MRTRAQNWRLCRRLFAGGDFAAGRGRFFSAAGWLLFLTLDTPTELWAGALGDGLSGSLLLSLLLIVALAVAASALVLDKRINGHGILMSALAKLSQCGYALPGAVLAQGFFVLAAFSGGHVVIFGGLGLILAACCTRFFLIAVGALESGMNKIPPQMDIAQNWQSAARRRFSLGFICRYYDRPPPPPPS